ncbi:MAG: sulfotransferase family 2 domain-containing protein [Algoriphagus sp.]|uniref:hypothetical protein n=1 Tax=Algoriphagus sp. TaxID=1872435 RepID=UPI0017B096F5|nr:hypothetical protein [Algoriphagus sp.]NVJ86801.1 sulfotransferase family 2 domain-containing protein [Algoriphagus sp.]
MAIKFLKLRRSKPYQYLKDKFLYGRAYIQYKLNPYPEEVGENPIFIFNHIPKCGGTSLNIVLRKWFHLVKDYPPHEFEFNSKEGFEIALSEFEKNVPNYSKIRPFEIIAGHFFNGRFNLSKRFPEVFRSSRVYLITFIREPLHQRISLFKYGKKRSHTYVQGFTLSDYIFKEMNFIAQILECDENNYKERVDSYFFVGLMEEYNRSLVQLSKKMNRKMILDIPHVNSSNSKTEISTLSEDEITKFKNYNKLDYQIYNYVRSKFDDGFYI